MPNTYDKQLEKPMRRYLALLYGAAENGHQEMSPDASNTLMQEWGKWARANQAAIVDQGMQLGQSKRVSAAGGATAKNVIVSYCIVQTVDHAAAASMFEDRLHVRLLKGHTIEAIEGSPFRKAHNGYNVCRLPAAASGSGMIGSNGRHGSRLPPS